jgi:nickel-dependent lactate racemase
MKAELRYGRTCVELSLPDSTTVYATGYPAPAADPSAAVADALASPVGAPPFVEAVSARRAGAVVVVVSDITRPVGYAAFLPGMLETIVRAGVRREDILVLVATGMHRPSTPAEREEMFGPEVAARYRIVDHDACDAAGLVEMPGLSWSGNAVELNRHFVEAGFRILTGLVEPHFMAGFSGGRKAVCPGLASLHTIRRFHGYEFLADPRAANGVLEGNPCHEEAVSVARLAGVDFSLNVVLDGARRLVRAFAGGLEPAHAAACAFARECACPTVETEADVVVTSSGGHPLDATFYQCVKGLVSCLPAVRRGGTVISFGGCAEGIGSPEYAGLLDRYGHRCDEFIADIRDPARFTKDQWELQVHLRATAHVGRDRLHFLTDGIPADRLARIPVAGSSVPAGGIARAAQDLVDRHAREGARFAAIPEGPYCAPRALSRPDRTGT